MVKGNTALAAMSSDMDIDTAAHEVLQHETQAFKLAMAKQELESLNSTALLGTKGSIGNRRITFADYKRTKMRLLMCDNSNSRLPGRI